MNTDNYYSELKPLPLKSVSVIRDISTPLRFARIGLFIMALFILILFLPWTQNVRSKGTITSYLPEDRPQTIQSVIAGQIIKWHVREGQLVKKGDTIVQLTEVKEKFLDPKMLNRYNQQISAKENSQSSTAGKVSALGNQVKALLDEKKLSLEKARNKITQTELKVQGDSAELLAVIKDLEIAVVQNKRADSLYKKGLISLTDLERRNLKLQESQSKRIAIESKLLISRNELINSRIEQNSLEAEYATKISKAESDLNSALSYLYETEAEIAKMHNEYANLSIRSGYYSVTAPQDGYVVKAQANGIGETISEGEAICTIMPSNSHPAVELYVKPLDVSLLQPGQKVRLQFDGWPAVVFSGWQDYSFGTFGGIISVIDNIDTEGKYRLLVIPDTSDKPWPYQVRVGSGAYGWIMLNDVPVWYELWRQFNGFPPDYTGPVSNEQKDKKSKG